MEDVNHLIQTQIELEREARSLGAKKYFEELQEQRERAQEDQTAPVIGLIRRSVSAVAASIRSKLDVKRTVGRQQRAPALMEGVEPEALAVHALKGALASVSQETVAATAVCLRIGAAVDIEVRFRRMQELDKKATDRTEKHLQKSSTAQRRRKVAEKIADHNGIAGMDDRDRLTVGSWLLDRVIESTSLFSMRTVTKGAKTVEVLQPDPSVLEWLSDGHDRMAMLVTFRMPMVVPPRPWSTPFDGGYLTDQELPMDGPSSRLTLVKVRDQKDREGLKGLAKVEMPEIYASINAIQETAWAVNKTVLGVAKHCWDSYISVGKSMPMRDPIPKPQPDFDVKDVATIKETDYQRYKAWALRAVEVHETNAKLIQKRISCSEKLELAQKFSKFEKIYFPYCMDFRGRVYPVSAHLQPQGDDLARGLLQFAEGKPITERGIYWLKVHIANCFGVDKVDFDSRIKWVEERMYALLDSAMDPMGGCRYWMEAEDPWQALAAIFELGGVQVMGPEYISHLSIPMDGSCNGLQNFSAMLKDPIGGKATNLLPADKPADIYTEVAQLVARKVHEDAVNGVAEACIWDGHISRKIVKQPVMTLPYGATQAGMRSQIEQAAKKNLGGLLPKEQSWKLCGYLAGVTYNAIGEVVVAARAAMDWLKEASRVAAAVKMPIWWTTPMGLRVVQHYRQPVGDIVALWENGVRRRFLLVKDGDALDTRRQVQGISPNFVHSLDASHMQRTVLMARSRGIESLSLIHDSYGTHAADTDLLHQCIRESFVEQYSCDVLSRFRDELQSQLPEGADPLPELPPSGTLDLSQVLHSKYFFA